MKYKITAPPSKDGEGVFLNVKFNNFEAVADLTQSEIEWFTKYWFTLEEIKEREQEREQEKEKPKKKEVIKYGDMDDTDG